MKVIDSPAELRAAREKLHGRVGVVMTMGALHSGHEALLRAARVQSDTLIATIFVNPLQFGPSEDFERYPRTLDADLATCARNEVDIAFTPTRTSMYPHGTPSVTIDPGPLGAVLEGSVRHGHFGGVLTVVAKLLSLTAADVAFFGEKDYQQLTLIRGMVRDLDLPVEIVGVPTVREADGLALSSRNRYLDPEQRALATGLPAALRAGAARHTPESVVAAAEAELHARGISPDYVELRAPDLGEAPVAGEARLLIAARIGTTRLIDNIAVTLEVGPR